MNATGTELLDWFGRVQAPDRKEAMKKDRHKSGGILLRSEAPTFKINPTAKKPTYTSNCTEHK